MRYVSKKETLIDQSETASEQITVYVVILCKREVITFDTRFVESTERDALPH